MKKPDLKEKLVVHTDEELERFFDSVNADSYAAHLALTVLHDRAVLRELRRQIEPMARQVISPRDNVFTKQIALIDKSLPPR